VAYPIVDLRQHGKDVRKYVEILEEAGILTLTAFGIPSARRAGYPGVWVHEEKIASIGVYIKNWVTRHGMALNVGVDPAHFAMIRPCGLPVHAVSMNDFVEPAVDVRDVESRFVEALKELLGWRLEAVDLGSVPGALDE
jgi:lipoyl(octanoyl) transferase